MPRLVIISDTHELHDQVILPDGDFLVHCGDFTNRGSIPAIGKFLTWFSNQSHQYKLFIAGNHSLSLDFNHPNRHYSFNIIKEYTNKYNNLFYLENSSIIIDNINIYGSPITPWFYDWAFNRQRGPDIAAEWKKIPLNTNILITHGPVHGILDEVRRGNIIEHVGCEDLKNRIKDLKALKAHCCGHLHYNGGQSITIDNVIYANASICTEEYEPTNKPIVIDL